MKILPVFTKRGNAVQNRAIKAIIKREKEMAKYVGIKDMEDNFDAFIQMDRATGVMANYAKSKGVRIDISGIKKLSQKESKPKELMLAVTNMLNGKKSERVVEAATDKLYPKVKQTHIMLPVIGEQDLQLVREVNSSTEDTFLRNLYRNIEEITHTVTEKPDSFGRKSQVVKLLKSWFNN